MGYSYFDNGISYFDGYTTYFTYFPVLKRIDIDCIPSSTISKSGYANLRVSVDGSYLNTKRINVNTQDPASLSVSYPKFSATSTISSNNVQFKLYNNNHTTQDKSAITRVTVSVSYFGPYNQLQTRSLSNSVSTILKGVTSDGNTGYFSYYSSYFTYYYNGNTTYYYYDFNRLNISCPSTTIPSDSYLKITPVIYTNCPDSSYMQVREVLYSVLRPYAISLAKDSIVRNGRTNGGGTISLYNRNSQSGTVQNKINVTAVLNNGLSRTASFTFKVEPQKQENKPSITNARVTFSRSCIYDGQTSYVYALANVQNDGISYINWDISSYGTDAYFVYASPYSQSAILKMNTCYFAMDTINVGARINTGKGLSVYANGSIPAFSLSYSGGGNKPTPITYYWIDTTSKDFVIEPSASGILVFVTNGTSATPISVTWIASDSSYYQYVNMSHSGVSTWIGRENYYMKEDKKVTILANIVGADGHKTLATKDILVKKVEEQPKIDSFNLVAPQSIAFNGNTDVKYTARLTNDTVKTVTVTNVVNPYNECAYFVSASNTLNNGKTSGVLGYIYARPEISHSGNEIRVSAKLTTEKGLTRTNECAVRIEATDSSYYQTYYAPFITSMSISGSSRLTYNGTTTETCRYSLLRDSFKSLAWSVDSNDIVTIEPSGNKCVVKANNTNYTTETVRLSATLTTVAGLRQTVTKSIRVSGAPQEESEKPSASEVEKILLSDLQTVQESLDNLKNKITSELSKLS